jgi:hypothetical protein
VNRTKTCVVPATIPGFCALYTILEPDDTYSLEKAPVVAWRVAETVDDDDRTAETAPYATPITCAAGPHAAVLAPDGSVHDGESSWHSADAWLAHENQHLVEMRRARAAKLVAQSQAAKPSAPVNPFAPRENNTNKPTLTLKGGRGECGS